jgi:hypothetical protein
MPECDECGKKYSNTFSCSVCGNKYCLSHREHSEHECIKTMKPSIRPLSTENWSWISYVVEKILFVILSISLILYLVTLLH